MLKRMEGAQSRKMGEVDMRTKYAELQNTRICRILFWISEMLQKFIIVYLLHVRDVVSSVSI